MDSRRGGSDDDKGSRQFAIMASMVLLAFVWLSPWLSENGGYALRMTLTAIALAFAFVFGRVATEPDPRDRRRSFHDSDEDESSDHVSSEQGERFQRPQQLFGRDEELAALLPLIQPGSVLALTGPPGIGKSALTSAALHALSESKDLDERFPDGVIQHGFGDDSTASVDLVLAKIARRFDLDTAQNFDDSLQRTLEERTLLFVLDDVEHADDLKRLLDRLAPAGVLLCTCNPFDPALHQLPLERLSQEAALHCFADAAGILPHEVPFADRLQSLLAGWPLGLFLAGRFHRYSEAVLDSLLDVLEAEGLDARDTVPETSGSASADAFEVKATRLLVARILEAKGEDAQDLLSIIGELSMTPFESGAIESASFLLPLAVSEVMEELADLGVLQRNGPRFQVRHPLIQAFARSETPIDSEALEMLIEFYERLMRALKISPEAGAALLDQQVEQLMELAFACRRHQRPRLLLGFSYPLHDLLMKVGGFGFHQRQVCELAIAASADLVDTAERGHWLGNLGSAHLDLGQPKQAIECQEQAIEIAQDVGDYGSQSDHQGNLGLAYLALDEPREAIRHFEIALGISRETNNRRGEGIDSFNLGKALAGIGRTELAIEHLENALNIFEEFESPEANLAWEMLVELNPESYGSA